jgi:hypothetical protein
MGIFCGQVLNLNFYSVMQLQKRVEEVEAKYKDTLQTNLNLQERESELRHRLELAAPEEDHRRNLESIQLLTKEKTQLELDLIKGKLSSTSSIIHFPDNASGSCASWLINLCPFTTS